MEKEQALENTIDDDIKPRLTLGNLIMLELCEKVGVSKERVAELRYAVMNNVIVKE
jgi:hypothetical protein